jgi:single-strand DNA-binding protein
MEIKTMSSFTINRVVLVGRLTRDPELRALPSGVTVCSLRVVCSSSRKAGGEYRDKPNYFDVSVFGAAADSISRYIHKGSRVGIDGRLEWREWESADHQKRQSVRIVADTIQFLDGGSGGPRHESTADGGLDADYGSLDTDHGSTGEYGAYEDGGELAGVGSGLGDAELVF